MLKHLWSFQMHLSSSFLRPSSVICMQLRQGRRGAGGGIGACLWAFYIQLMIIKVTFIAAKELLEEEFTCKHVCLSIFFPLNKIIKNISASIFLNHCYTLFFLPSNHMGVRSHVGNQHGRWWVFLPTMSPYLSFTCDFCIIISKPVYF